MIMAANSKPPTIANLRFAMPTTDDKTFAGRGTTAGFSGGLVWTETC
jgi:hypothetical protein